MHMAFIFHLRKRDHHLFNNVVGQNVQQEKKKFPFIGNEQISFPFANKTNDVKYFGR